MKPVKEIVIALLGDDEHYKSQKEYLSTINERKNEQLKTFDDIEQILSLFYITRKNCKVFDKSKETLSIVTTDDISFDTIIELLRNFEENYHVAEFSYHPDYDKDNEQEPFARFCLSKKKTCNY